MILEPHTVVDPWAVVVHLQDTTLAHAAMMAPIGLVLRAPLAIASIAILL